MKIAYILRSAFGEPGEAASYQYATRLSKMHDVLALSADPCGGVESTSGADTVRVENIYSQSELIQLVNVHDHLEAFRPDIVHILHSPLSLKYLYNLKRRHPYAKWILDFRSPHIGTANAKILKRNFYAQFYADKILTHSKASLKTNLTFRFRRATEIPPGVDLSKIKPRSTPVEKFEKFVFAGNLTKTRKLDYLIYEFAEYCSSSMPTAKLEIFGKGNYSDALNHKVHSLGMTENISLLGYISQDDLFRRLPEYDAGLAYVPDKYFDSAPSLKSLEYAAAGIPIFASNTRGHRDYIDRFGFEFYLFQNVHSGLKNAILDAGNHASDLNDLLRRNVEAVTRFNWSDIIDHRLLSIYNSSIRRF